MKHARNKLYLCIGVATLCILAITVILNIDSSKYYKIITIKQMKDGLLDSHVRGYYQNDINDVYRLSNTDIEIRYEDIDLNDDGYIDKLVIVRSGLHSGSGGDTFDILINDKEGNWVNASTTVLQTYDQNNDTSMSTIYVAKQMANGFHNIIYENYQGRALLIYENGMYELKKPIGKYIDD